MKFVFLAGVAVCPNLHSQWSLPLRHLAIGPNRFVPLVFQAYVGASIRYFRSENRCDGPHPDCATFVVCSERLLVWQDSKGPGQAAERPACKGTQFCTMKLMAVLLECQNTGHSYVHLMFDNASLISCVCSITS